MKKQKATKKNKIKYKVDDDKILRVEIIFLLFLKVEGLVIVCLLLIYD